MIVYNKITKDEPINNQIKRYEKTAEKWRRQIKNYMDREEAGLLDKAMAVKQINFCVEKLNSVNSQLKHLRQFAEV